MARVEDLPHRHRAREGSLKFNFVNRLTTGRNRDASLGPTPSGGEGATRRGARLAGAVLFDPAPGIPAPLRTPPRQLQAALQQLPHPRPMRATSPHCDVITELEVC